MNTLKRKLTAEYRNYQRYTLRVFLLIVFFSTACCFLYCLSNIETDPTRQSTVSTAYSSSKPGTSANTNNEALYPSFVQVETPELLIQKQPKVKPLQLIPEAVAIAPTLITTAELASVTINT